MKSSKERAEDTTLGHMNERRDRNARLKCQAHPKFSLYTNLIARLVRSGRVLLYDPIPVPNPSGFYIRIPAQSHIRGSQSRFICVGMGQVELPSLMIDDVIREAREAPHKV